MGFVLSALLLVAALILGGGTRSGFLADAILELVALPSLVLFFWWARDCGSARRLRLEPLFCGVILLVPLVQLIPWPAPIGAVLPSGAARASIADLLSQPHGSWSPISVAPIATWLGILSLLVPVAVFLGVSQLPARQRRWLSLLVLAVGLASAFLGLVQLALGPYSGLRPYGFTNLSEAVGFFANRNHFAALLYCLTLLAAAWVAYAMAEIAEGPERSIFAASTIIPLVATFTVLVVLVAAQTMARSRAGLGLTIVALVGALLLTVANRQRTSGMTGRRLILGATAVAVILAMQFALYRIMDRFAVDPFADARVPFARNTVEAATAFMPFGAGVGSFVSVYGLYEKAQDAFGAFANRAHNDVLEVWLETGILAPMLFAVFAIWLIWRGYSVWRRGTSHRGEIDQSLARAATLIIVLLLMHSLVDYPLRTGAMMAVLAFSCALLVPPPESEHNSWPNAQNQETSGSSSVPRARITRSDQAQPPSGSNFGAGSRAAQARPPRPASQRWGRDIEWPNAWRTGPEGTADRRGGKDDDADGDG